jgi:uncharacterized glyoxalase superfamily protein PhnB
MSTSENPFGLHTVTPYFIVWDVKKLIAFLEVVFDATLRGDLYYRHDKSVQHAEMRIGDSVIMMGEPTVDIMPMPSGQYVYVEDCDRVYELALKNGATSVSKPSVYPHGDRYGGIRDFAGNIW